MESQEEDLQLLCFTFYEIRTPLWLKLAIKRTKRSGLEMKYDLDSMAGFFKTS